MHMRTLAGAAALSACRFTARDDGQDLLEYGLLASLIATFVMGALGMMGEQITGALWGLIAEARF
jgi:Flp pilus assembly pilin Flp